MNKKTSPFMFKSYTIIITCLETIDFTGVLDKVITEWE
jgi:hypothetical protein